MDLRAAAERILAAALAAAEPRARVAAVLRSETGAGRGVPLDPSGRVLVLAVGKAATGMALGALDAWGDRIAGGAVCTIPDLVHPVPPLDVWAARHPTPDAGSLAAAGEALRLARGAREGDLVLCLLSGGASSLWAAPGAGLSLEDLGATTSALLRAGVPIGPLNTVRKHLSRIGGGWLARAAAPARVATLAISDVVGAPYDVIGSGPTLPDPTTFAEAMSIVLSSGADVPRAVLTHLQRGMAGEIPETPKPGEAGREAGPFVVIADNATTVRAAAEEARRLGFDVRAGPDGLSGEASRAGAALAAAILAARHGRDAPTALVLGGETTVTVRGDGRGGRNQELALAAALALQGIAGVAVGSFGTDGIDGPTPAAGAIVDGGTTRRAREAGLDAAGCLAGNDSYTALAAAGDLLVSGATGTNVADVAVALAVPDGSGRVREAAR
jgi:glycerate 2-kinase